MGLTFATITIGDQPPFTQKICSNDVLDDASKTALDDIEKLVEAISGSSGAAAKP
jgi:hypothetical protein